MIAVRQLRLIVVEKPFLVLIRPDEASALIDLHHQAPWAAVLASILRLGIAYQEMREEIAVIERLRVIELGIRERRAPRVHRSTVGRDGVDDPIGSSEDHEPGLHQLGYGDGEPFREDSRKAADSTRRHEQSKGRSHEHGDRSTSHEILLPRCSAPSRARVVGDSSR